MFSWPKKTNESLKKQVKVNEILKNNVR